MEIDTGNLKVADVCRCSCCGGMVTTFDIDRGDVADHRVYEVDGSLDFIELAHKVCAIVHNLGSGTTYWSYD